MARLHYLLNRYLYFKEKRIEINPFLNLDGAQDRTRTGMDFSDGF